MEVSSGSIVSVCGVLSSLMSVGSAPPFESSPGTSSTALSPASDLLSCLLIFAQFLLFEYAYNKGNPLLFGWHRTIRCMCPRIFCRVIERRALLQCSLRQVLLEVLTLGCSGPKASNFLHNTCKDDSQHVLRCCGCKALSDLT